MANDRDPKSESVPAAAAANHTKIPETKAQAQAQAPAPLEDPGTRPDTRTPILAPRALKQLGLFVGGAAFLSLSTLVTRRAVARKLRATQPRFFIPSNRPVDKMASDNSLIALEALNLATLNVIGFGIMTTGGLSWAFDVSSVEELRRMARSNLEGAGATTDEEAEKEIEEWVAKVLYRKDQRDKGEQKPDKEAKKTN